MRLHQDTDNLFHDSPMIAACYEAHLAMEEMLAVFAELRGDDAEAAIGESAVRDPIVASDQK